MKEFLENNWPKIIVVLLFTTVIVFFGILFVTQERYEKENYEDISVMVTNVTMTEENAREREYPYYTIRVDLIDSDGVEMQYETLLFPSISHVFPEDMEKALFPGAHYIATRDNLTGNIQRIRAESQ